jgi:ubiquinone/menaquinone biosynthesis C-methylase UbiE
MISLAEIASQYKIPLFDLFHQCAVRGVHLDENPSESQIDEIEKIVAGIHKLSANTIDEIWSMVNSEKGKRILARYAPFIHSMDAGFMEFLAKKLFDELGGQLKAMSGDINQKTIETVLNLGVSRVEFTGGTKKEIPEVPKEILAYRPNLLEGLVEKFFRKGIERETSGMHDEAVLRIKQREAETLEFARKIISPEDYKTLESRINGAIESASRTALEIAEFKRKLDENAETKLKWHQAARVYSMTRQNTLSDFVMKRTVFGDCTGAGKTLSTLVSFSILRAHYKRKNPSARGLIVSHNQAIHSVWGKRENGEWLINRQLKSMGLNELNILVVESRADIPKISDKSYDLILINYEKLRLVPDGTPIEADLREANDYLDAVIANSNDLFFVAVDEAHNLKNVCSNTSRTFKEVVEATKNSHFVVASATTIPNRVSDIGFLLYMKDPRKYRHYRNAPFDFSQDKHSIFNEIVSKSWFEFTLDDLKDVFSLGPLPLAVDYGDSPNSRILKELKAQGIEVPKDQIPSVYELSENAALEYFEMWKQIIPGKIEKLSEILLNHSIPKITKIVEAILAKDPNARISIFSRLQKCFSEKMKNALSEAGLEGKIGTINGNVSAEERDRIAGDYRDGRIKVALCSNQISESFSLVSGSDNNYFILAEPTIVPGVYTQIKGRGYRLGQTGNTFMVHLIPQSRMLEQMMAEYARNAQIEGIKSRKTFKPRTIYEDIFIKRLQTTIRQERAKELYSVKDIYDLAETAEEPKESNLPSMAPVAGIARKQGSMELFSKGVKAARGCQGISVEALVESCMPLLDAYTTEDLMKLDGEVTTVRKTAEAIEEIINEIEVTERRPLRVLDWGCGPACLARQMKKPIYSLDAWEEMIAAGEYFLKKEKKEEPELILSPEGAVKEINGKNILIKGNARKMPFADRSIDFVSSSYAAMYNQQGLGKRELEEIFLETNRVLSDNGYGLLVLPNRSTRQDHLGIYEKMLKEYGFEILGTKFLAVEGPKNGFGGAYTILYRKTRDKKGLSDWPVEKPVIIYYKEMIIGGDKTVQTFRKRQEKKAKPKTEKAGRFVMCDFEPGTGSKVEYFNGTPLRDYIRQAIS